MRKQTVVISINTNALTNYLHLPPRFEVASKIGKQNVVYDVMIHSQPRYQLGAKGVETNFDLFINNHLDKSPDEAEWNHLLPADMIHVHPRYPKHTQAMKLLAAEQPKNSKFRPVRTWSASLLAGNSNSYSFGHDPEGSVVIKPREGARGIGHFIANLDMISLGQLFGCIKAEESTAKAIEEYFAPHVSYHPGDEREENEGLKSLREQGMVMQETVEGIKAEYRVLVDHNSDIFMILPRERVKRSEDEDINVHGTDYRQGTGSSCKVNKSSLGSSLMYVFDEDETQIEAFKSLVKQVIPPMNSLDLFITEDGHWGIFEFSNQFGTVGVPVAKAHELHYNYIKHILDQKYNK
jgi:hypothetical protein